MSDENMTHPGLKSSSDRLEQVTEYTTVIDELQQAVQILVS